MARLSLLALVTPIIAVPGSASAVYPRFQPAAGPGDGALGGRGAATTGVAAAAHPLITTAPLIPQELLHRRATVVIPGCAKSCIDSAVTNDTPCSVSDVACGCVLSNAAAISSGAYSCVEGACGILTAFNVFETLEDLCLTYAATDVYTFATTPGANTASTTKASTSKATTSTSAPSATSSGSSGSGSSSGGSSGSSGSSSDNSGSSSSKSSSSLSKGAIAGIAIGAAGGAIIVCAIIFLIYRCTSRKGSTGPSKASEAGVEGGAAAAAASAPPPAAPAGGSAAAPGAGLAAGGASAAEVSPMSAAAVPVSGNGAAPSPPPGQTELDGKSSLFTTTTASGAAQSVSPASAQTAQAYPGAVDNAAWQQQQYAAQQYAAQQQYAQQQYAQQLYAAQQQQQQPYIVQGYSIAPGQAPQPQAVVAPAGYAAALPSQPVPGVIYQEAPAGIPQAQYPQELSGQAYAPAAAGAYEMPSQAQYPTPVPQHVVPVAVGPAAALPVQTPPAAVPAADQAAAPEAANPPAAPTPPAA